MSAATGTAARPAPAGPTPGPPACLVYAVVPATTRTAGPVTVVPHREIAALVRPAPVPAARSSRQDLLGYAEVLDRLVETAPVLPMRYGTALPSVEAVRREVLVPHHDVFADALARLTGRAQFTVRARYLPDVALREVLAERPDARRLHRRLRHRDVPGLRVRLGELVAHGIAGKRRADADAIVRALRPHAVAARVTLWQSADVDPIGEAAFLVDLRHRERFESTAERFARERYGRLRLRLLGPMAPYHFVAARPKAGR